MEIVDYLLSLKNMLRMGMDSNPVYPEEVIYLLNHDKMIDLVNFSQGFMGQSGEPSQILPPLVSLHFEPQTVSEVQDDFSYIMNNWKHPLNMQAAVVLHMLYLLTMHRILWHLADENIQAMTRPEVEGFDTVTLQRLKKFFYKVENFSSDVFIQDQSNQPGVTQEQIDDWAVAMLQMFLLLR